jgi:IclR family transcriptional regulator, pca regulon regulatory protein
MNPEAASPPIHERNVSLDEFPSPGERMNERDFVTSFARGLEVIRVFTRNRPKMSLSDVAKATGMTRATVRRFLLTLEHEGYVAFDGKLFSLTPKVLELGISALSSMDIWDVVQPIMDDLADRVKESVFSAVLDGHNVMYVARSMSSSRIVSIGIHIGSRAPAHCASTGRVLLAALPDDVLQDYLDKTRLVQLTPHTVTSKVKLRDAIEETRRQGWSIVDQELEVGLRSLSVPIRNRFGTTVAALNVCCPTPRWSLDDMRASILTETLDAANRIMMTLQG